MSNTEKVDTTLLFSYRALTVCFAIRLGAAAALPIWGSEKIHHCLPDLSKCHLFSFRREIAMKRLSKPWRSRCCCFSPPAWSYFPPFGPFPRRSQRRRSYVGPRTFCSTAGRHPLSGRSLAALLWWSRWPDLSAPSRTCAPRAAPAVPFGQSGWAVH